jgi:hypothetical protein
MSWLKSGTIFVAMLALFALGLIVVGFSEGGDVAWPEIALVTVTFGVWWLWKRNRPSSRRDGPGKYGAA